MLIIKIKYIEQLVEEGRLYTMVLKTNNNKVEEADYKRNKPRVQYGLDPNAPADDDWWAYAERCAKADRAKGHVNSLEDDKYFDYLEQQIQNRYN